MTSDERKQLVRESFANLKKLLEDIDPPKVPVLVASMTLELDAAIPRDSPVFITIGETKVKMRVVCLKISLGGLHTYELTYDPRP